MRLFILFLLLSLFLKSCLPQPITGWPVRRGTLVGKLVDRFPVFSDPLCHQFLCALTYS